ncbi:MAG: hypothetical protein WBQ24_09120 [Xanthobacteraceae bacterium]
MAQAPDQFPGPAKLPRFNPHRDNERLAAGVPRPQLHAMLTIHGAALIAELIAAAALIIALIGFRVRRTTPWLLYAAIALAMLMTTVVVIVGVSST